MSDLIQRIISAFVSWIGNIDLATFSNVYLTGMLWAFIISIIAVCVWYGLTIGFSLYIRRKLKSLREMEGIDQQKDITNKFNEWMNQNKLPSVIRFISFSFMEMEEKKAWNNYYHKIYEIQKSGEVYVPDVYDFFLEDNFVLKFGNRKLIDVIPSIFISAGILGTFIGLIAGLGSLQFTADTETIRGGIIELTQGMTVAFLSSIVGIILSLLWQAVDKLVFYPRLINSYRNLRHEMDLTFPTQEDGSILLQMARNQKSQMEDFQDYMSKEVIPTMVKDFSNAINNSLQPHFERTNEIMEKAMDQSSQNQMNGVKEMVDQFVQSLQEVTGDHMKELGQALNKTVIWQEKVHHEMSVLVQSMQDSAREQSQMVEKTTTLTEQIHHYTDKITDFQITLHDSVSQLSEVTQQNVRLHTSISDLLEKMTLERQLFDQIFDDHISKLYKNVDEMVNQTGLQVQLQDKHEQIMMQFKENIEEAVSMTDANRQLSETLTQQANISTQSNDRLQGLLDKFILYGDTYGGMQKQMVDYYEQIVNEREHIDTYSKEIRDQLIEQLDRVDSRMGELKVVWDSSSSTLTETNIQLSSSMNHFAEQMNQGLERTFKQFDTELSKSVQSLTKGVGVLENGIEDIEAGVRDLPNELDKLNHYLKEFNKETEQIQKQA